MWTNNVWFSLESGAGHEFKKKNVYVVQFSYKMSPSFGCQTQKHFKKLVNVVIFLLMINHPLL